MICRHLDFILMILGVTEHVHMGYLVSHLEFSVHLFAQFSAGSSVYIVCVFLLAVALQGRSLCCLPFALCVVSQVTQQ